MGMLLGICPPHHGSIRPSLEALIAAIFPQISPFLGTDPLASTFNAPTTFSDMIGLREGNINANDKKSPSTTSQLQPLPITTASVKLLNKSPPSVLETFPSASTLGPLLAPVTTKLTVQWLQRPPEPFTCSVQWDCVGLWILF